MPRPSRKATGHWRNMFDNAWVGAWDVFETDVIVTIESIVVETVTGQGGRKEECPVMYSRGGKKGMILNVTNAKTIAAMHGELPTGWPGKRIRLYADTCKAQSGETVPCVRVRAGIPPDTLKDGKVGQPGDPQGPDGVQSGADELRTALGDGE